jgi:amidohydrolase/hippurate hydrolase
MGIFDALKSEEYIQIRRVLHQHPELAWHETETSKFICDYLSKLNIPFVSNVAKTGVVGLIEAPVAARTLILRADMDALPIIEKTGLPFASVRGGIMHACGHDAHVAMLLGAAKQIMKNRDKLNANIKLVFQPAEEGNNGAETMIKEGVMTGGVIGAVALHVDPTLPTGFIGLKKGAAMAANDAFEIVLKGMGGHGATPSKNSALPYICAQIVDNLYSIVARRFDPIESAVIAVCNIDCGTTFNVMPSEATIRGTIRSFADDIRELAPVYIEQIVGCLAAAYDIEFEFNRIKMHAPVVNNSEMVDKVAGNAENIAKVMWNEKP